MSTDRITVLHFCEHFGGAEASLHGVARAFQWWIPSYDPKRFRILLCSRKGRDKATEQMEESGLAPLCLGYGKNDPRNLLKLISMARRERVDIIHAHGFGASLWGRLAGHLLRIPVIVHGRANYGRVPAAAWLPERILGPLTKHAFAVSESTRQFMIQKRHMPASAVQTLYNGILMDHVTFINDDTRTRMRASLGAQAGSRVVGVVGRIVEHKEHLTVFRAMQRLVQEVPEAQLWIVGDGDFAPDLEAWIADHNAQSYIRMLGFRRDVIEVIQCFDVQVFPSRLEGTPNTLYEAMAVGNAVVATPTDGQGELLHDGEDALMFDCRDDARLTEHLRAIFSDPHLLERLRTASRERGPTFDGRRCIRTMEETYARIVAGA